MDSIKERFNEKFPHDTLVSAHQSWTYDAILAFIKEELNKLAEEVDKRKNREDMNLEIVIHLIRSKADELV